MYRDLSNNRITGTLPQFLAQLSRLVILRLDHNAIGGMLPLELLMQNSLTNCVLQTNHSGESNCFSDCSARCCDDGAKKCAMPPTLPPATLRTLPPLTSRTVAERTMISSMANVTTTDGGLEAPAGVNVALVGGIVGGVVGAVFVVAAIVGCVLWRQRRALSAPAPTTSRSTTATPGYTNGPEVVQYNDVHDVRQPKSTFY